MGWWLVAGGGFVFNVMSSTEKTNLKVLEGLTHRLAHYFKQKSHYLFLLMPTEKKEVAHAY